MPLQISWHERLVKVTSPDVSISGQVLHDFIEDQMASPRGLTELDILQPEGKIEDPTNPGVYSQIILYFNSPWQVQFWQGSGYTRIYGAKIIGGLNDQPIKATGAAGDITVLESPVDGLTIVSSTGTLLTPTQAASFELMRKYHTNKMEIDNVTHRLKVYEDNGIDIAAEYDLQDAQGDPNSTIIFKRIPV